MVSILSNTFQEEAARGFYLSKQINNINEETEIYTQVTEDSILRLEEANMNIMKNVKKLKAAVKQHETRLTQLQQLATKQPAKGTSEMFIF